MSTPHTLRRSLRGLRSQARPCALLCATLGALGGLSGQAEAQRPCLPSVGYNTALQARTSHARTYSAMTTLEEQLLPATAPIGDARSSGEVAVFYLGLQSLFDAVQVPACAGEIRPYDVHAYRVGMGARWDRFGLYYSTAANMGMLATESEDRWGGMMVNYLVGHAYATVAPAVGQTGLEVDDLTAMNLDYVLMLTADLDLAEVGVGYVGSTGLYLTVLNNRFGAFVRGLVELKDDLQKGAIQYLSAGLEAFSPLERPGGIGVSDAWVRKRKWSIPTEEVRQSAVDFWLARVGQRAILHHLDLHGGFSWAPEVNLRDLTASLHTKGYHPDLIRRGYDPTRNSDWAAGATVSMVNLPSLPSAGVEGGQVWAVSLDALYQWSKRDGYSAEGFVRASLRRNHPDTLEIFPFAQNAWDFNLEVQLVL